MPETTATDIQQVEVLIRRLVGGDPAAAAEIRTRAVGSTSPLLLVAAATLAGAPGDLLTRAAGHAMTSRDRQLVQVAAALLAGDDDLLDALVRDHLADHPDNLLAAWIALQHSTSGRPAL